MFSINLIILFKLGSQDALTSASDITKILNKASFFASRAKLGEMFFESIPQFLTQVLMTSGKGDSGIRELTPLQKVSVVSSAVTIAFGVSKYGLHEDGNFLSRNHSKISSYLILFIYALSEIAFCGGLCRFSFAMKIGNTYPMPILIPFVTVSSGLALATLVSDLFRLKHREAFILTTKIGVWICIVGIFFQQAVSNRIQDLKTNNSIITFFVTMTITSMVNFTLGFFIHRRRTDLTIYKRSDFLVQKSVSFLRKVIDKVVVLSLSESDKTKNCHDISIRHGKNDSAVLGLSEKDIDNTEQIQNNDAPKRKAVDSVITSLFQFASRNQTRKRWCSRGVLLITLFLPVFSAIIALFTYPLMEKQGYHVKFYHDCIKDNSDSTGFPVVSASEYSKKGSICVYERSTVEMVNIGKVIARQIRGDTNSEAIYFVDNLSYEGIFAGENINALESPFLQPTCNGTEKNLMHCKQYGLNVGLSTDCFNGTNRLYTSIISNRDDFPGAKYLFMIEAKNFSASKHTCQEYVSEERYSSRILCQEESDSLMHRIPNKIMKNGIWLGHGGHVKVVQNKTQTVLKQYVGKEILPSICVVHQKGTNFIFFPTLHKGCFDLISHISYHLSVTRG